jgi:hypothetical protein
MIIVVVHNPQDNQLQLHFEGGTAETVKQALSQVVSMLDQQLNKPRIIVPQTAIPRDIDKRVGEA